MWSQALRTTTLFWWISCTIFVELYERQPQPFFLLSLLQREQKAHCPFAFWSFCKQLYEGRNTNSERIKNVQLSDRQIHREKELFHSPKSHKVHGDIALRGFGHNKTGYDVCLPKLDYLPYWILSPPRYSCFTSAYLKGSLIWFSKEKKNPPKWISLSQRRDQILVRFLTLSIQSPPIRIAPQCSYFYPSLPANALLASAWESSFPSFVYFCANSASTFFIYVVIPPDSLSSSFQIPSIFQGSIKVSLVQEILSDQPPGFP